MAAKGEKEMDVFKLFLKVDLIDKRKQNKNAVEKLQKAFQTDIVLLQQHLKDYPGLQSQHINCVTKQKKHLEFEFWLKSVKALEELKLSTENNSLVNALSDFSEKRGFNLDVGLDSQHLCFKCKMEKKHYAQGVAHLIEDTSESSDEEVEEAADQQKQSNMPQGAPCGTAPQEKKVFGEFKKEEMTPKETIEMKNETSIFEQSKISGTSAPAGPPAGTNNKEINELQSSANGSNVDAQHSEQEKLQTFKTSASSGFGSDAPKTPCANVPLTGSSIDKFKQPDVENATIEM